MTNAWKTMAVVVPLALLSACTDAAKAPAEAAVAAAGAAVSSLTGEAGRYAPDAVKAVEKRYASARDLLAKKDYKGALAAAQEIPGRVKDALSKSAGAKEALTRAWDEVGGSVSKTIETARSRIQELSKAKKLPRGVDKAALANAQAGVGSLQAGLASATQQFQSGDMAGAISRASSLRAQGAELLRSLGL